MIVTIYIQLCSEFEYVCVCVYDIYIYIYNPCTDKTVLLYYNFFSMVRHVRCLIKAGTVIQMTFMPARFSTSQPQGDSV